MSRPSATAHVHEEAAARLVAMEQRYTKGRREIVAALAGADRPLTVPEILRSATTRGLAQSSAYRNLSVLLAAGVVRRLAGTDDLGRFELDEALSGHHHHLLCDSCGAVADVDALPRLERALAEAARVAGQATGFEVRDHRIDLVGRCTDCRS